MDPGAWAAYGQHYQRLGAGGVNPSASSLSQSGQLNDLSLSASLPRQDSIGGYGSTAPSLLLSHHGLNVGQGGHHGEATAASFVNVNSASLLPSGYDPMISATFQTTTKGHLSALNVSHGANLYKAMAGVKESEIGDLRGGFVRRGMPPTSMAPDPNMSMATSSGLFNPQTPPPHSWRHSNIVSNPASSPFGVLPHEAVLPRSGVGESMDKLHSQDHRSKSSRMMMDTSRYSMEQELASAAAAAAAAHGYRNVLSAQSRSAAMMDPNSGSRGSLMMQQPDTLGPGAESIGLTGLKPSDYALYSNSNVNATRGLLPQNYITQSHFSPHQDLQGEKRDLYDISLLAEKVDGYGGSSTPKSHLDLFGSNSPSVSSSGNGGSLHGMSPSPSQRASHRSSSSSQSHSAHSRQMCSSQSHPRVTTHSATYTTYSSTSTATSYSQSYHPSPQPSPSQSIHSPAHYSSTTAVDFSNTVPAHSAHTPVSSSQYPQTSSVLVHSDSPGVVYSSVITRATVPPSSTGTYTSPMLSQKSLSSKQHLNHNEPKLPTPTPPPQQPQSAVQRSYEPVIHTPDISNDNCMGDILPASNNIPSSMQRVVSTPTGSTGGGSASSTSNLTMDHSLIRSPSIASGPTVGGRGSADSACTSPKSIAMDSVFNSQQMTLQDLADMSSSNDKMDLESGTVGLLPPKESLVDDEPHLMDLSQPGVAPQHGMPTGVLDHMGNNHMKEEKSKKKRPRKKKKELQEEATVLQAAMNSANGTSAPPQIPMMPMGMPPCSHAGQMTQSMCPPEPPVNQLFPSSSCSSRPCMSSPLMSSGPNYSLASNAHQMFPSDGQPSVPVESCLENAPAFSQNGSLSVAEGIEPDILSQGIPPSSPPLASLFDPLPTSPQGNAEAAAFEAKLRNEASQIAKQLDKRGPSIEDDLGFLAELPPICNVACEKRKPELCKASVSTSANFIDSFLRFLENTDVGPGQSDGGSNSSSHRHGGRGRGKSRETFTTPPQGKNVELNPVTGLFVCTEKNRGLTRGHGLNSARYQNSLHRRSKASGKFDLNVAAQGKDDAIPAPSALTFSSDEEEGMANQGFVDSVKIALQSLSDNEGYDASQEPANWAEPSYNDSANQNTSQDARSNWASPKPTPGNGDPNIYGLIKEGSNVRMDKIGRNNTEKWSKKEVSQNSEQKQSVSEPNNISDCSDKEFFDLALPRRESSVRKCKEKTVQKKKEKVSKRKRHDHDGYSDDKMNSSGSETDIKPGLLYDSANKIWPSVAKDGVEPKFACSGSEEETVQKHSSSLRGRRKGYSAMSPSSGSPRGKSSGRQIWSPDTEHSDDLTTHSTKIKKSRGRGKSKASKYSDNKEELKHVIREGGFRAGDFIILLSDKNHVEAPLWRIEGHGVLQKFEPFKEGDKILYKGKPNGSGIKMGAKSFYEPATVQFVKGDKTNPVVEYLKDYQRKSSTVHLGSKNHEEDESLAQKENFEVYLQTLISQVLDPNFISEIVKENDEYFLSHVHEIDGIVIKKKNLLAKKIPWNTAMRDCAEHFPTISVRPFTAEGGGKLMCQACAKERVSLRNITFEGQLYDYVTLSHLNEMPLGKKLDQREFSLCTDCTDMVQAYTHMHHQKYNLFIMCVNKVNSIRSVDPTQESHVILEQCLQDSLWINKLFCKIRNVWRACAVMCR